MRLKISLVAVLALVVQAQGALVLPDEAASAVRGWVVGGSRLGHDFSGMDWSDPEAAVASLHTNTVSGVTNLFYSVKLKGRGTFFVSADTEYEPIIGFVPDANKDYSADDCDWSWPLRNLLSCDAESRIKSADFTNKWNRLWSADPQGSAQPAVAKSDMRVLPLIESKWGQTTNTVGEDTWNYYTPTNEAGTHYPCGSTATAIAQIMRYYHGPEEDGGLGIPYPQDPVITEIEVCYRTGSGYSYDGPRTIKLNVDKDTGYVWTNMPLDAENIGEEDQRKTIGALASDIGAAIDFEYTEDGLSEITDDQHKLFLYDVFHRIYLEDMLTGRKDPLGSQGLFTRLFDYKQASWLMVKEDRKNKEDPFDHGYPWLRYPLLAYSVFASLDMHRPCILAIGDLTREKKVGYTSYTVVADGYGFEDETHYVHLNMGKFGDDDCWYSFPVTAGDEEVSDLVGKASASLVEEIGYKISPDKGGVEIIQGVEEPTHTIVSGRVLDKNGDSVPGATVIIYEEGKTNIVETLTTNERGMWATMLSHKNDYDVEAKWGLSIGGVENVISNSTAAYHAKFGNNKPPEGVGVDAWGNDIVLGDPIVLVGNETQGYEPFLSHIGRAIVGARDMYSGSEIAVKIVSSNVVLKTNAGIDFKCVVFATNAVPLESAVSRTNNAAFTVAPGGSLVFSNIVFSAEEGANTLVNVQSNGWLAISGTVDFGVWYKNAAVKTADANGFRLLGPIDDNFGFALYCTSATNELNVVGFCCGAATLAEFNALKNCVSHIANYKDSGREVRAFLQNLGGDTPPSGDFKYKLVWLKQAVPFEDAVAYYVEEGGTTTNAAGRLDTAIDSYTNAWSNGDISGNCIIGIRKDDTMSRPLIVGSNLTIIGDNVEVSAAPTAGFTVTGGVLSVSGVSFSNYVGNALFLVNGAGASLSLSNMVFSATEGTTNWSGAVAILNGSASVANSTFDGCKATGKSSKRKKTVNSCGGAIYVAEGCQLFVENSTITNCTSTFDGGGGGIYAMANSVVSLSGDVNICGNTSGSGNATKPDDIRLINPNGANTRLVLSGTVDGRVGVRWAANNDYGNTNGLQFAEAVDGDIASSSAKAFFCDVESSDVVAVADGTALRWADAPVGPQPLPSSEGACAYVPSADGSKTNYYASVADAITVAKGGETIFVGADDDTIISLDRDVTITTNILLASTNAWCSVCRTGDYVITVAAGASLTVSNVTFYQSVDFKATKPLFDVCGGTLTLDDGAEISGIEGKDVRNAGAVSVWKGGTFAMKSGATIRDCQNTYTNDADRCGRGGAVLVDDGRAVFTGGSIYWCRAYTGGGVFIGNKGSIEISGDTYIYDNYSANDGNDSNLVVCDSECLILSAPLTNGAFIGYAEGAGGDARMFCTVATNISYEEAAASAHKFVHDKTGDVGMAVTNAEKTILVWSSALDDGGKYVDKDGNEYYLIDIDGSSVEISVPSAEPWIYYRTDDSGTPLARTGVVERTGFTVSGNVATTVGVYTATATLRPGYAWTGGSTDATNIEWSIGKATYNTNGVTFASTNYWYDSKWHVIEIEGELPKGVTVSYENNRQRDVGIYTAIAHFTGDADNYNLIDDMIATLTITNAIPAPTWPAVSTFGLGSSRRSLGASATSQSQAQPLASSEPVGDNSDDWVISSAVPTAGQWYSLYETDSLSNGFNIENMVPVERKQAEIVDGVPVIRFVCQRTADESRYWRIVAEP